MPSRKKIKIKINNGTRVYETRVPFDTQVLEKRVCRQRVQNYLWTIPLKWNLSLQNSSSINWVFKTRFPLRKYLCKMPFQRKLSLKDSLSTRNLFMNMPLKRKSSLKDSISTGNSFSRTCSSKLDSQLYHQEALFLIAIVMKETKYNPLRACRHPILQLAFNQ